MIGDTTIGAAQILHAMSEGAGSARSDVEYLGLDEAEAAHVEYIELGIDVAEVQKVGLMYAGRVRENGKELGLGPTEQLACAFAMGVLSGVKAEKARSHVD